MRKEMGKDRPWINKMFRFLKNHTWNYTAEIGCLKVQLINDTGSDSVRGTMVQASLSADKAFETTGADDYQPIGVVAESGIADGAKCWIIIYGPAYVLLKDTTASTRGFWVFTSSQAGRADATLIAPPGGGIPELETHMQECGHCLETVTAGTDKLALVMIHFN